MRKSVLFTAVCLVAAMPALAGYAAKDVRAERVPGSVSLTLTPAAGVAVAVTIEFESVSNLSLANVGLSASLVDPLDAGLLARLPGSLISVPADFPVAIVIEPPPLALMPLEFDGIATVSLVTSNLPYYPGTRLRLFSAHDGGDFVDITEFVGYGSYRVRGTGGEFSEFLIVADQRSNSEVVAAKLSALQTRLAGFELDINATVFATLDSLLDQVALHWAKGDRASAQVDLDDFAATLVVATPAQIPATWNAAGSPDNVGGILRSLAATLSFSLQEKKQRSRHDKSPLQPSVHVGRGAQ